MEFWKLCAESLTNTQRLLTVSRRQQIETYETRVHFQLRVFRENCIRYYLAEREGHSRNSKKASLDYLEVSELTIKRVCVDHLQSSYLRSLSTQYAQKE